MGSSGRTRGSQTRLPRSASLAMTGCGWRPLRHHVPCDHWLEPSPRDMYDRYSLSATLASGFWRPFTWRSSVSGALARLSPSN